MNILLFEDAGYLRLLPLTWLRPAFDLRCGRDRLIDKIRRHAGPVARLLVRPELHAVAERRYPLDAARNAPWTIFNARALVTGDIQLPPLGVAWKVQESLVAATITPDAVERLMASMFLDPGRVTEWVDSLRIEPTPPNVRLIDHPWDLVQANTAELVRQCRPDGEIAGKVYPGAHLIHPEAITIKSGAAVKSGTVLDAEGGPIWIDERATVEPCAVVQGPCFIGAESIIRPGASIREGTTIGPVCKVGGEVECTIFQGYSNKQHDGFLGHSFVAPWVNLGAGTTNSDLKNTYGTIRVHLNGVGVETGLHFVGSTIGDHTKTGIGTLLTTGCVLGVAANVFATRVPKFVPSFAWLTDEGMKPSRVDKIAEIARIVMARRKIDLDEDEAKLLALVAQLAQQIEVVGWANAEREIRTAQ